MEDLSKALKKVKNKKMTSLKKEKKSKKDYMNEVEPMNEEYSYGTRINLGTDEIDKLGIDATDFNVGSEVVVLAKAKVAEVSKGEKVGKKVNQRIELQITDIVFS